MSARTTVLARIVATTALACTGALAASAAGGAPAGASRRPSGAVPASGRPGVRPGKAACVSGSVAAVNSAIARAGAGSIVAVCRGTYHGEITVTTPVHLVGDASVIDAQGFDNGILVTASGASVQGFAVAYATGEGILVEGKPGTPISKVTILENLVQANDQGNPDGAPMAGSKYAECNGTAEAPGDCGEGIHLMTVTDSVVEDNTVTANSGGILLSDELGPTDHNLVIGNVVTSNLYDCGITVVSHSSKGYVDGAVVPAAGGVYDNTVKGNVISGNGLIGQGGGVILATPLPGGAVYDNTISNNAIEENGLSGVTVHSHTPDQYLDGNVIEDNQIGANNLSGDPDFAPAIDSVTTGVFVGSAASPISITVSGNTIGNDVDGIFTTGPVTVSGTNTFSGVTTDTVGS